MDLHTGRRISSETFKNQHWPLKVDIANEAEAEAEQVQFDIDSHLKLNGEMETSADTDWEDMYQQVNACCCYSELQQLVSELSAQIPQMRQCQLQKFDKHFKVDTIAQ